MTKLKVGDLLVHGLGTHPELKVLAIFKGVICLEVIGEHQERDKYGDKTIAPVTWYRLEDWENSSAWSVKK